MPHTISAPVAGARGAGRLVSQLQGGLVRVYATGTATVLFAVVLTYVVKKG